MAEDAFEDFQGAVLSDSVKVVEGLLQAHPAWVNQDISTPDAGMVSPLYQAITTCFNTKNTAMVHLLLKHGASLSKCNQQFVSNTKSTPLVQAAMFSSEDCPLLNILLDRDVVDNNIESRLSFTALYHASRRGDIELVQTLINKGFDVNWLCDDLNTAVHAAAFSGHLQAMKLLLKNGAEVTPNNSKTSPLHLAVRYNHMEIVKLLLDNGSDVNEGNSTRFSPLMMACSCDLVDIVKVLLERGADVNNQRTVSSPFHFSPLSIAAFHGKADIVSLLVDYGADVNTGNECSITPLHIATNAVESIDSIKTVEVMIQHGANMNKLDSLGRSALIYALSKGREMIAGILIKHGSNLRSGDAMDPLYFALITSGVDVKIMYRILMAGYDVYANEKWLKLNSLQEKIALWEKELDSEEFEEREVKCIWLKQYLTQTQHLQELCRIKIRQSIVELSNGRDILPAITKLPITEPALRFLRFEA